MIDLIRPDTGSTRFEYEWERQFAALNHHAIVSITDARGRITYVNSLFCEVSGYSQAELIGNTHSLVKSGVHDPAFYKDMWQTIMSGQLWKGEVCNRRKDGSYYWVESTITPFMDNQGQPYQFVSIRTDITRMKEHERELIAARNEAEAANQAKSQFLASMSHELRTPMNAILGFSQLMEFDRSLPAQHQESVHEILTAGNHLLALINDVLDLARIESGRMVLSTESVSLTDIVDECVRLIRPLAEQRTIQVDMSALLSCQVMADKTRLKQVILNLLSNAVKYNKDQGRVTISSQECDNNHIRLYIRDTGSGISAANLTQLFQPFNRLDADASDIEGTGVGLNLAKQIIELMGGTIGVESTPDEGSSFWITLPLNPAKDSATDGHAHAPTDLKAAEANKTILYVDDNPSNIKLLRGLMTRMSDVVMQDAHTAELGLELAREHQPDLIILDINMPDMDGYELLELIKQEPALEQTPVMALTANAMHNDVERGLKAGFEHYVTKPLDVKNLLETIEQLLNTHGNKPNVSR